MQKKLNKLNHYLLLFFIAMLQGDLYHEIVHISSLWHHSSKHVSQSTTDFMPLYIYIYVSQKKITFRSNKGIPLPEERDFLKQLT